MAANVLLLQGKIRILQVMQVSLAADYDKHVVGFLVSSKKNVGTCKWQAKNVLEGEKFQYKFCNHYHKLQSIFAIITQHPQATSSVNGSCHKSQRAN